MALIVAPVGRFAIGVAAVHEPATSASTEVPPKATQLRADEHDSQEILEMPIVVPVLCHLGLTDARAIAWLVATTATIATTPRAMRPWLRQRRLMKRLPSGSPRSNLLPMLKRRTSA